MSNHFDPDRIFASLEEAAEEMVQAEYQARRLEEIGDILLGRLILKAIQEGRPATVAQKAAKTYPEWETHIEGLLIARQRADRAKAKYKDLLILSEARRTQESSLRAMRVT